MGQAGTVEGKCFLASLIFCSGQFQIKLLQAIERDSYLFPIHVNGEVLWSSLKDGEKTLVWTSERCFVDVYMGGPVEI